MAMPELTPADYFQTEAEAVGKTRSPVVARRVRAAMTADVLEERSHVKV